MEGIQPGSDAARWVDAIFQQVLRHVGPTQKAGTGQGLGESLRLVAESARLVPFHHLRFASGVTGKQGLEAREVSVHQTLNGVTKQRIV